MPLGRILERYRINADVRTQFQSLKFVDVDKCIIYIHSLWSSRFVTFKPVSYTVAWKLY